MAAVKLTDSQIAHIVYTADNLDIENAKQALDKNKNEGDEHALKSSTQ